MGESAPREKCHAFICYRQMDGLKVAEWLFQNLQGRLIRLDRSDETLELDVYLDQDAPAIDDWQEYWRPKLEVCRALVFICTKGAAKRRDGKDWVYAELDYWLEKKDAAPIVVDATSQGGLYVPNVIKERWPNAQRVVCTPQLWQDSGTLARMEKRAIARILHGIKLSEEGVYFKELEHLRELNRNLQLETARAEENEERATDSQVNLQVNNGVRAIEDGDLWASAVWFSEALRVDAERGAPEDEHRVRLRSVARCLPALRHVWFVDTPPQELRYLPSGPRLVAVGDEIEIFGPEQPAPLVLEDSKAFAVDIRFDAAGQKLLALSRRQDGGATVHELAQWDLGTGGKTTLFVSAEHTIRDFSAAGTLVLETAEGLQTWTVDGAPAWAGSWAAPEGEWRLAKLTADGQRLIAATQHEIWTRETVSGSTATQLGRFDRVDRLATDPANGRYAAVCGHIIRIWFQDGDSESASSFDLSDEIGDIGEIIDLDFNADGKHLVITAKQKDGNRASLILLPGKSSRASLAGRIDHEQAVERWEYTPPTPGGAAAAAVIGASRWNPFEKAARFSPDGRFLAAASKVDDHVRVWDWRAGRPLTPPLQHFGRSVTSFGFSADGSVVTVSGQDGTIRAWSFARPTGDAQPVGSRDRVDHLVFSPDGSRIAFAGYHPRAEIWRAQAHDREAELTGHEGAITAIAFSPDGRLVATGSYDKTVRVHNAHTGEVVCEPLTHLHPIVGVSFHSATKLLTFAGAWEGPSQICAWDLNAGRGLGTLSVTSAVTMATWGPSGTRAAVLLSRSSAWGVPEDERRSASRPQVWDLESDSAFALSVTAQEPAEWVAFSDDGSELWVYAAGQIEEFSARDGASVRSYTVRSPFPRLLAVSPDGSRIATGKWDRQVQVIDRRTGDPVTPQMDHQVRGSVDRGAFSADGSRLLTVNREQVRVWSAKTGNLLSPPFVHDVRVNDALLDSGGGRVVISTYPRRDGWAGYPSTIQFWSLSQEPRAVHTLRLEAEVASARHIDSAGGLVPLSLEEYRSRWKALSDNRSPTPPDDALDLWHREQATSGDDFGRSFHADQVMSRLGRRISAQPTNVELYAERIRWLKRAGHLELVVADQTSLIRLEPRRGDNYVSRALVLAQLGRSDAALADYATAIELAPDNRAIRRQRGQLYAERKDLVLALADLGAALEVHSREALAPVTSADIRDVYSLAYLATLVHDEETYRAAARRALTLLAATDYEGPSAEGWNSVFFAIWACILGPECGFDQARWTSLLDALRRTSKSGSANDLALLSAAIALRSGDHAAAERTLCEMDLHPWDHLLLALSMAQQGKRAEAKERRERAREDMRTWADQRESRGDAANTRLFASGWPTDAQVAELLAAEIDSLLHARRVP